MFIHLAQASFPLVWYVSEYAAKERTIVRFVCQLSGGPKEGREGGRQPLLGVGMEEAAGGRVRIGDYSCRFPQ